LDCKSRNSKQRLINEEDPQKPLSDQALSNRLKAQGLEVARRTVAKYREEENIPAANLRKVHRTLHKEIMTFMEFPRLLMIVW